MQALREYLRRAGRAIAAHSFSIAAVAVITFGMVTAARADEAISTDTPEATVASLHRGLIAASQSGARTGATARSSL